MRYFLEYVLSVVCAFTLAITITGCSGIEMGAIFGGSASAGGVAYYLLNLPWMSKLCYYVGDEAAMVAMADANRTIDADTIAACAIAISYCQTAEGLPASQVNATLAQAIANLPATEQAQIQEAAGVLDDFLPPSTAAVALTSNEINDLVGFLQGWTAGTQTEMNEQPAPAAQAKNLAQVRLKVANIRAKHPPKIKAANYKGGWFKPVVPPVPAPVAK